MRKALVVTLAISIALASYAIWPFWSVYQLRQALKAGDLPAIDARVEWQTVRTSLRQSLLSRLAAPNSMRAPTGPVGPSPGSWRTMWRNVKSAITVSVVENTVDRLLTPAGLARLFAARETYRRDVLPSLGINKPKGPLNGTWLEGGRIERAVVQIKRLKAIDIISPTRVEMKVQTRYNPNRHYITVLQLKDYTWKLVGLRLLAQSTELSTELSPN